MSGVIKIPVFRTLILLLKEDKSNEPLRVKMVDSSSKVICLSNAVPKVSCLSNADPEASCLINVELEARFY